MIALQALICFRAVNDVRFENVLGRMDVMVLLSMDSPGAYAELWRLHCRCRADSRVASDERPANTPNGIDAMALDFR